MVASFCLRLAAGLIAMLPFLPAAIVPPRFYRVQFLTALGLLALSGLFLQQMDSLGYSIWKFWIFLILASVACLLGSIIWHLDGHPGGAWMTWITPVPVIACLVEEAMGQREDKIALIFVGDALCSSLVLGSAERRPCSWGILI